MAFCSFWLYVDKFLYKDKKKFAGRTHPPKASFDIIHHLATLSGEKIESCYKAQNATHFASRNAYCQRGRGSAPWRRRSPYITLEPRALQQNQFNLQVTVDVEGYSQ